MPAGAPFGAVPPVSGLSKVDGFEPVNELEHVLWRCIRSGARATLLRALARSSLCVLVDPSPPGLSRADTGGVQVPCVADSSGRHALVYTSYRQLAIAHRIAPGRTDVPWYEVPAGTLFERWPRDVDVWLNAGGQLSLPLDADDLATVADLAAGLEVSEAYEIGPDDRFTDFPGPTIPDQVDCAVVLSLFEVPEVLEVFRLFRRLEEPGGRTWRIVLVLTDRDVLGDQVAQTVVAAVNSASDECCEVHIADVGDDDVYDTVGHLVEAGVPLWRRDGFRAPDTLAGLETDPTSEGDTDSPPCPDE